MEVYEKLKEFDEKCNIPWIDPEAPKCEPFSAGNFQTEVHIPNCPKVTAILNAHLFAYKQERQTPLTKNKTTITLDLQLAGVLVTVPLEEESYPCRQNDSHLIYTCSPAQDAKPVHKNVPVLSAFAPSPYQVRTKVAFQCKHGQTQTVIVTTHKFPLNLLRKARSRESHLKIWKLHRELFLHADHLGEQLKKLPQIIPLLNLEAHTFAEENPSINTGSVLTISTRELLAAAKLLYPILRDNYLSDPYLMRLASALITTTKDISSALYGARKKAGQLAKASSLLQ